MTVATIGQTRGMLLEEIILSLLGKVGYRTINPGEDGTRVGSSGLELRGRGTWHQIDALAALDHGPAFTYPIRLLVEAKCYARNPVDISTIRNCVGVLRDVSENYFVQRDEPGGADLVIPRFNFLSAVFSASGFTTKAQRFALAHQVFLIQYKRVTALQRIISILTSLAEGDFRQVLRHDFDPDNPGETGKYLSQLRQEFRRGLIGDALPNSLRELLSAEGGAKLTEVIESMRGIRGSYYGMIQGKYPVHLLSPTEIPANPFLQSDEIRCRIYSRRPEIWFIEPTGIQKNEPGYFRLEFGIPDHVARMVQRVWGNPNALADVKRAEFSFVALTGIIGGVRRQVRLILDHNWLSRYLVELPN